MIHPLLFLVIPLGYALSFLLLHLYAVSRNATKQRSSPGCFDLPFSFSYRQLFLISALGLFFEMLMIRWLSSEIRIFAYYKNFVLIACFLGFGLGCALCRRRVHPLATALPIVFFTVLVAAPIPGLHDAIVSLSTLVGMTSQTEIWQITAPDRLSYSALAVAIAAVAPLFSCIVFTFIPFGQVVGSMLEIAPRGPRGYTINVIGSLIGIVLYTAICFASQPPAIWFLVGAILFGSVFFERRKALAIFAGSCLLVSVALTVWVSKQSFVYWSPYQKLTLTPIWDKNEIAVYALKTNDTWYQQTLNLSPDFLERHKDLIGGEDIRWNPYNLPYRFMPSPKSVLVLGSGMGNDVAAALRNTTASVTAVEIDPLILALGKNLHFEKPYQSSRVHIINDDARSYIQDSSQKFDLILFSLLDSHTTASSFSNIRIDNFVYTREAIARAKEMLTPDGMMILKFYVNSPWIGDRLAGLIQQAFQSWPFEIVAKSHYGTGGHFYIIGSPQVMARVAQDPILGSIVHPASPSRITLTTDDWPYFYQKERGLPGAVLGMGGFLICLCWFLVRRVMPRSEDQLARSWSLHFFLLGAGFMLFEAQIISKMALLFGTTWVVNSIVISGLLVLIVFANLIFERWPAYPMALPYLCLLEAAALAYLIPLRSLLFPNLSLRICIATLLLCLPVLFAGMVFIRSFSDAHFSGTALGWNLIGAVLGGMLETLSQATGLRVLVLLAAAIYVGSWIARRKAAPPEPIAATTGAGA